MLAGEGECVCLVEQFPQCRGGGCDGGGEQCRATCQRCEDGTPALGAVAEQYGVSSDIDAGVDDQELAGGTVPVKDGRAVPTGFLGPVRRVLIEQGEPGAVDHDPADEVSWFLVGAAQELFFSQYQP